MLDPRYADVEGPPRDPRHSLDDWTLDKGREDRHLDAAIAEREAREKTRGASTPDVYEVASKVLDPFLNPQRSIPRRYVRTIEDALAAQGLKPTRANKLRMAAHFMAQEKIAEDPELSLALLMRAAFLFKPEGGWHSTGPRKRTEGFPSVRALLIAAFSELRLGAGETSFEVAQNRARTHSLPGEVFVSASHSGTSNARNASAIERSCDAQRILAQSGVHPSDIRLLFARLVLDLYRLPDEQQARREWTIAVRARFAPSLGATLPTRPTPWGKDPRTGRPKPPPKDAPPSEVDAAAKAEDAWFLAAGLALHGDPPAPEDPRDTPSPERHIAKGDRALCATVDEAEQRIRTMIGQLRRMAKPRRRVQSQIHAGGINDG